MLHGLMELLGTFLHCRGHANVIKRPEKHKEMVKHWHCNLTGIVVSRLHPISLPRIVDNFLLSYC